MNLGWCFDPAVRSLIDSVSLSASFDTLVAVLMILAEVLD